MTRIWAGAGTAAVGLTVALSAQRLAPVAMTTHRAPAAGVASMSPPSTALAVAARFVVAVDTVDDAHPHGDLTTLRTVAAPGLVAIIVATPPALTQTELAAGTVQRARVVAVAGRRSANGADVTVTAELEVTSRSGVVLRTAVANTFTVAPTADGWRVSGIRS